MRNLLKIYIKLIQKFLASTTRKRFNWKKRLTKFLKVLYLLISSIIDFLGHLLTFWKRNPKVENPNKILIVKTDQFGDVLFSTFLVPIIKEKHPQTEIHYLINPKTEVLLKENSNVEKVHFWRDPLLYFILGRSDASEEGFWQLIKEDFNSLKKIRKENYDLIINTRAFAPSSSVFFKLMASKNLVAFDASEQSFLADFCASYNSHEEEWENYLKLLEPLGVERQEFSPQFYNFDDNGLDKKFPDRQEKLVTIAPISFDEERLWEIKYWQKVIKYLEQNDYQVTLTGLPSQKEYLSEIATPFEEQVKVLTNLTIPQLGSLIKDSEFLLCIEAFVAHLGIALEKPVVCLVNEEIYFLEGLSDFQLFVDTKSMVPLIDKVVPLSVIETEPEEVIEHCQKIKS